jgi:putative SOS response-associated peptidase YedK
LALLLPNYSIGSNFRQIEETLSYEFSYNFIPSYVTRKDQLLPIILDHNEGKIDQAKWGIRNKIKHSNIYPWVRAEGIIKNIHTRILIRNNRCLIPANGFFINKNNESTYFIYFPKNKIVTFGGIWRSLKENEMDRPIIVFSIISCAAYGKISALTNRIPVIIHPAARRKFVKKNIPLMDITRILRKEGNLEYNGIPIPPDLLSKSDISGRDFHISGERLLRNREFPEKSILGSYYYHQS